ncbi:MAG: NAD-dependent epimerase/dehydratase family protein [Candidatus Aenigmatarchaeota archaeon]
MAQRTIAITGISGYIGQSLLKKLENDASFESIIGMDVRPMPRQSDKVKFYQMDVSSDIEAVLKENNVDAVVHCAFVVKMNTLSPKKQYKMSVIGTRNVFETCAKLGINHIIYTSSLFVYEPNSSGLFYGEESELIGNGMLRYSMNKIEVEKYLSDFIKKNPQTVVTNLRIGIVIGPNASSMVKRALSAGIIFMHKKNVPKFQFIHEDDIASLIITMLGRKTKGTFNITSKDTVSLSEITKITGAYHAYLGNDTLCAVSYLEAFVAMMAAGFGAIIRPKMIRNFKTNSVLMDVTKMKKELDFKPKYSSIDALKEMVK